MNKGKSFQTNKMGSLSFKEKIELGEYDPEILSLYPEWKTMSPHVQLQYIRAAMDNRRKQLLMQWAELDRSIDARLKPQLETAKKNIERHLKKIEDDRERYYLEYTSKM